MALDEALTFDSGHAVRIRTQFGSETVEFATYESDRGGGAPMIRVVMTAKEVDVLLSLLRTAWGVSVTSS